MYKNILFIFLMNILIKIRTERWWPPAIEYNIEKRIRDVVKRIYLDKISHVDPEMVNTAYSFVASGILGLIKFWINSGMKNSPEEMADFSRTLTVGGIREFFNS